MIMSNIRYLIYFIQGIFRYKHRIDGIPANDYSEIMRLVRMTRVEYAKNFSEIQMCTDWDNLIKYTQKGDK